MLTLKKTRRTFFKRQKKGQKFVKFWGEIWEKDDRTPEMLWRESVSEQLRDKITNVKEFNITEESLEKETKKRKNWTAPGIDSI